MKKMVDNLRFNDKSQLVCKGKNGKECPVFKKQGSLDGACAILESMLNTKTKTLGNCSKCSAMIMECTGMVRAFIK